MGGAACKLLLCSNLMVAELEAAQSTAYAENLDFEAELAKHVSPELQKKAIEIAERVFAGARDLNARLIKV